MLMDKYIRSKSSFVLGLVSGIAIISTVGFLIFLGAYAKDKFGGSLANTDGTDQVAAGDNNAAKQPADGAAAGDNKPVDIKVASTDHIRGNKNAKVTIVEFSDYQCPFCSRFHDTMKQVMAKYPNQVRWVFKHFPLDSIHPYARKAAEAAECAGEQNKFWEYSDAIYANQTSLNTEYLSTAAKNVGLNVKKFETCLSDGKTTAKVNADFQQGQGAGVRGTPGSFINGQSIPGAVPFEQIEGMIKPLL